MSEEQRQAVADILAVYRRVATGETYGAGGSFLADGQGTLTAVWVPVELMEALAAANGQKVYGRTRADREQ